MICLEVVCFASTTITVVYCQKYISLINLSSLIRYKLVVPYKLIKLSKFIQSQTTPTHHKLYPNVFVSKFHSNSNYFQNYIPTYTLPKTFLKINNLLLDSIKKLVTSLFNFKPR